jgi:hypothetical protein
MGESPAYRALTASTRALLMLLAIEVQVQGGMIAEMTVDDLVAATGMRRSALDAALTELQAGGFILISMTGRSCMVALSSAWRRA